MMYNDVIQFMIHSPVMQTKRQNNNNKFLKFLCLNYILAFNFNEFN